MRIVEGWVKLLLFSDDGGGGIVIYMRSTIPADAADDDNLGLAGILVIIR